MPAAGEPMWLDTDQDKVLAWLRAKHEVCPHCGTVEADWVDPDTGWLRDDPKWEAVPYRCHGCAATQKAAKSVPERTDGVRIVLVPARDRPDDEDDEDLEEVS